jgi:hypothetical protein
MFKGEWGTRKSTQALSFPKPQYWFDFDQKMEGLVLPMKLWGIDPKEITFDTYNKWSTAEEKLKRFQELCPFKTLIIDSVSSCADTINAQTLALKSGTSTRAGEEAGRKIAGIAVNTEEDYKAETAALQTLLRLTKDIHKFHKVNIILIAHVIQAYQKIGSTTRMARTIVTGAPKAAAKMPGYCHEIYQFSLYEGMVETDKKYALYTNHTIDDFARTALPLDKQIVFEGEPIYDKYLIPAMNKLTTMKVAPEITL